MFSHHSTCAETHLSGRGGDNPAIPPRKPGPVSAAPARAGRVEKASALPIQMFPDFHAAAVSPDGGLAKGRNLW